MPIGTCIAVLTALSIERESVVRHLTEVECCGPDSFPGIYQCGMFSSSYGQTKVVVAQTGQTNVNAALETERVLQHFQPSHAFFVGVAGGLKDVRIGDVVIGSDVIGYERGKAGNEMFLPRPQFGASSYDLERGAALYASSDSWGDICESLLDRRFSSQIQVFLGTIASGEKVNASHRSELHRHIARNASHALAIEMEGLGFLKVCMTRPLVKSLLLRGISDLIDNKAKVDDLGSQQYAAQNAAAFLFGFISHVNLVYVGEEATRGAKVVEIACKLYPRGIEDRGIWQRAGGDLSLVPLGMAGKGQWVEALRLVDQGGGGPAISVRALVAAMLEDFPRNKDLIGVGKVV